MGLTLQAGLARKCHSPRKEAPISSAPHARGGRPADARGGVGQAGPAPKLPLWDLGSEGVLRGA